jgi:molybdopterin-guanine dinucleotide biosynthesis protein A
VTLVAIVLAGGGSTRFGGDKLAATLDGRPVLAHAVDAAAAVADRVIVVLGPDDPAPSIASIELVRDPVARGGPLAGLVTALEDLGAGTNDTYRAIVLAGDMPRVDPRVLRLLVDALNDPGIAAVYLEADPLHPLPLAIRPDIVLPAAQALLAANRRSLRALVDSVRSAAVPAARWRTIDPAGATLLDIDTRADLDAT